MQHDGREETADSRSDGRIHVPLAGWDLGMPGSISIFSNDDDHDGNDGDKAREAMPNVQVPIYCT